jgi:hypothetical protein
LVATKQDPQNVKRCLHLRDFAFMVQVGGRRLGEKNERKEKEEGEGGRRAGGGGRRRWRGEGGGGQRKGEGKRAEEEDRFRKIT